MGIDFHIYHLTNRGAQETLAENYLAMASSLRSHRHRKGDIWVALLDLNQSTPLECKTILQNAGKAFFETPGTVTNAIQTAAGLINSALLEINQNSETNVPVNAAANFVVCHNGSVFIAQAGITYTLVVDEAAINKFDNLDLNERGLGASRRFYLNFKQTPIGPGNLIILSTPFPSVWDENRLTGITRLGMEEVRSRLLDKVDEDFNAVVVKCREGKGIAVEESWNKSQHFPAEDQRANSPIQPQTTLPATPTVAETNKQVPIIGQEMEEILSKEPSAQGYDKVPLLPVDEPVQEPEEWIAQAGQTEKPVTHEEIKPPQRLKKQNSAGRTVHRKSIAFLNSLKDGIKGLFVKIDSRLSPEANSLEKDTSGSVMSFIVIAIPILLITISVLVYIYSGRREQHQTYLEEAQTYIAMAASLDEPAQQREYWSKAYGTVLKAMDFGDSDLADSLLVQTQSIIDDMDLVTRLDFRPATTSQFASDVSLSKIKSNASGVYLLDDNSGKIFHIIKDSKGFYDMDASFQCAPGTYGVVSMGKIVDFVMLPTNTRGYELLAIDAGGNLLYCQPGENPDEGSIIPPTDEWGRIAAISLDEYTLYVADAEADRIWSYSGRDFEITAMAGIVFSSHPVDFLGAEEADLGGVLDLIVNKEDLFILHQDSHMTTCQYNPYREGNATECQDPTPYGDSRIGYEKNPLVYFNSQFRVIQETQYPNSAFYILDSSQQAIMQFSYQLNLEKLIKPQPSKTYPLPDTAMSGLGITSEKELFLAYGNQLYIADLP